MLGMAKGATCAVGLALGGSAAGCAQLVRGALNTPEATRCGPTVALEATSVRKRGHRMT